MHSMFSVSQYKQAFNFDTSEVKDMGYMFHKSVFNQPLNVENIDDISDYNQKNCF